MSKRITTLNEPLRHHPGSFLWSFSRDSGCSLLLFGISGCKGWGTLRWQPLSLYVWLCVWPVFSLMFASNAHPSSVTLTHVLTPCISFNLMQSHFGNQSVSGWKKWVSLSLHLEHLHLWQQRLQHVPATCVYLSRELATHKIEEKRGVFSHYCSYS